MEAIRRVMLRKEVALQFDDVISQAPATRCVTVFTGLIDAIQGDAGLSESIKRSGVMEALHVEAKRRHPQGNAGMPALFDLSAFRERGASYVG